MEQNNNDPLIAAVDPSARACLDRVDEYSTLPSTNSYLLQQPAPKPGHAHAVLAGQQTQGRGQRGKDWYSPPLAGLYLSVSYTMTQKPENFSCLTLAAGTVVLAVLESFDANGIELKWPNDLIFRGGKLGGILTEIRPARSEPTTVIIGLGLNLDMADQSDGAISDLGQISDLRQAVPEMPDRATLAAAIVEKLILALRQFEADGFASFHARWKRHDWLQGKAVRVVTATGDIDGIACGIGEDGALLVNRDNVTERILSGSVTAHTDDAPVTSGSIAAR